MARERTGGVRVRKSKKGTKYYARVKYVDQTGKKREIIRSAENRTEAKQISKQLLLELEEQGEKFIDAARMTFSDLADKFVDQYIKPAEYRDGRKIAGMRAHNKASSHFKPVRDYFDKKRLRDITYGDIEQYRSIRLSTQTRTKTDRSIATVNRELSLLRRVLGVAVREGWLRKNPYSQGEPLISLADERSRQRILTKKEEIKLLEQCTGRRAHLKPIIICAVDTGMRQGEIFNLRWRDIDFDSRMITVEAFNTKTMRARQVAMTNRLADALFSLYAMLKPDKDDRVFNITNNIKHAFTFVRKEAGLLDVRFHDLRHTAATRLIGMQIPLQEAGRVLGHTQANTTYRYVNANQDTVRRAAAALDAFNEADSKVAKNKQKKKGKNTAA